MEANLASYHIDGWLVQFPQEWKCSLDQDQSPPQIIFEAEGAVTVYLSAWNWSNPKTGERPDRETVLMFFLQAFAQQGVERTDDFLTYCPAGFSACVGKSVTTDGYLMISFAFCAEGCALTVYFVYEEETELEQYLLYLKRIELAP